MSSFIQRGSLSPNGPHVCVRTHAHQDLAEIQAVAPGAQAPHRPQEGPASEPCIAGAGWPLASRSPYATQPTPERVRE